MHKKLIALAIAAAFSAPAFADTVTAAYGTVDVGYGSVSNTDAGNKTGESGTAFSQNQTSRVGIKSTEDLGNGMKASYQLEMGLSSNPASDANFGAAGIKAGHVGFTPNLAIGPDRVLTVGLDLGQGTTLTAGKMSSPLRGIAYGYDAQYGSNLIGNLVTMDPSTTARTTAILAAQNFGAVTATLGLLSNTTTADGNVDNKNGNGFEATATFKQDALAVSGGYRSLKKVTGGATATSDATNKVLILAASFDLGMAKLYGQFAQVKDEDTVLVTTNKNTYESFGVNVPVTSEFAAYLELSMGKTDNGTVAPKLSALGVGAKYDLGKHTYAYGHYGTAKVEAIGASTENKVNQIAFGMVHSF